VKDNKAIHTANVTDYMGAGVGLLNVVKFSGLSQFL